MNQAEIGAALQVFYNLRYLSDRVDYSINYVSNRVANIAKGALDVTIIANSVTPGSTLKVPPAGQVDTWRSYLWTRINALLEAILSCSLQIWTFYRVLCKKKDTLTKTKFIEGSFS